MKTHFKKLQNPNYLGSWDLYDNEGNVKPIILTASELKKEMVHDGRGGTAQCTVLYFKEKEVKPMILNATNLKAIAKLTGSNFIEDWSGFKLKIEVKKIKAFGEMHDALRITEKGVVVVLPDLCPTHPKWESARKSIKDKTATLSQIKKHFTLTPENEILLCK